MADVEEYFGCECLSLGDVSQFLYSFYQKDESEEDNVIYFSVNAENYFKRVIPHLSLNPRYWKNDIEEYCYYHFFRRVFRALKHIRHPSYTWKYGIFGEATFSNKDLIRLKEVLSNLTKKTIAQGYQNIIYLENNYWELRFVIDRDDNNCPCALAWRIQFLPKNLFNRFKSALRYIFGKECGQQSFDINKTNAAKLKGLIDVVEKLNKEIK